MKVFQSISQHSKSVDVLKKGKGPQYYTEENHMIQIANKTGKQYK